MSLPIFYRTLHQGRGADLWGAGADLIVDPAELWLLLVRAVEFELFLDGVLRLLWLDELL